MCAKLLQLLMRALYGYRQQDDPLSDDAQMTGLIMSGEEGDLGAYGGGGNSGFLRRLSTAFAPTVVH